MRKLLLLVLLLAILPTTAFSQQIEIAGRYTPSPEIAPMPIVIDATFARLNANWSITPERDRKYWKFLSAEVIIRASGGGGSGTIVAYKDGWAYVATCGHLWNGTRSAEALKRNPERAKVIVYYHNEEKLSEPKTYTAEVLFWSNNRGYDAALIRFKPDWQPKYFPIAPVDYEIKTGTILNSIGCDGLTPPARYEVEFIEYRSNDLITRRNSPRPGRSGGGLITDDGWYVATCWGTTDTSGGGGIGLFTRLSSIHKVYTQNGYEWLLNLPKDNIVRRIPLVPKTPGQLPEDFVPIPEGKALPLPKAA